ncbi:MAG: tRNA (adenosine(37)-N6)-threonylcarbamoyltransferase complex dimerization subunit type 1 TsaB [Pedobacter sp.]|nr:MAG: tRNA (adenosine(37)-N6)-threonylcarbamoyltransferase complex dimerization subunit type 1 TsaB [Pedobacter sp.]
MAIILQIETATQVCSVALAKDGNTIAVKELQASNIHASSLTLFIQDVMETAGLQYKDLDAIAVSKGPGSYTGLRIGVSTAKGLCYALDKPLIGINTLTMMAGGYVDKHPDYKALICPMIDARRMEVFTAVYDQQLNEVEPVNAKIIDAESFSGLLAANELVFIGDGADKCSEVLQHTNSTFSTENYNSAANMSKIAYGAFVAGAFEDVAYFEPFYLKDFVLTTPKVR